MKTYELGGVHFIIHDGEVYCRYADVFDAEEEAEEEEPEIEGYNAPIKGSLGTLPKKIETGRKPRLCGNCGKPGHNAKTCDRKVVELDTATKSDSAVFMPKGFGKLKEEEGDKRSNRQRVEELWRDGLDVFEMSDELPDVPLLEIRAIWEDLEHKARR